MRDEARTLLHDLIGTDIDPDAEVDSLSLGERQLVELAKSVRRASSVLILDEPTTCLSLPERRRLFDVVRRLQSKGYGILYVTHFMEEVYDLGERIVVSARRGRGGRRHADRDSSAAAGPAHGRARDRRAQPDAARLCRRVRRWCCGCAA